MAIILNSKSPHFRVFNELNMSEIEAFSSYHRLSREKDKKEIKIKLFFITNYNNSYTVERN